MEHRPRIAAVVCLNRVSSFWMKSFRIVRQKLLRRLLRHVTEDACAHFRLHVMMDEIERYISNTNNVFDVGTM